MIHTLFLMNTNIPFIFLFGPLVYAYSESITGKTWSSYQRVLHLFPFIFYLVYSFFFFLQDPSYKLLVLAELLQVKIEVPEFKQVFSIDPWDIQGWVVVEILSLHLIVYGVASLWRLRVFTANAGFGNRLSWIRFVNTLIVLGGVILFLSEGGIINGTVFFTSPFPNFSGDLFSTLCLFAMSFYLLFRPEFLKSIKGKYQKSSLSKSFMKDKMITIQKIFEQEKLFLNTDFSLDLIAQKTGLSKHHISQIINSEMDCNFFELTNHYRIQEAKRILQKSENIKIEQLAYQLGYKSKSSFFNAFKKATNQTPSGFLTQYA